MKTGNSKSRSEVVFKDMNSTNLPTKQLKKHAPAIKTEAFGDKENLVERTHSATQVEPAKPKIIESSSEMVKDKIKRVTTVEKKPQENVSCEEKIQITADDLTSTNPSENYWRLLAEQQREALNNTLEENKLLHHKVELLETENETLKQALQEATDVIEVLNQIVNEDEKTEAEDETENASSSTNVRNSPTATSKTDDAFGNDSTICDESDDSDQE